MFLCATHRRPCAIARRKSDEEPAVWLLLCAGRELIGHGDGDACTGCGAGEERLREGVIGLCHEVLEEGSGRASGCGDGLNRSAIGTGVSRPLRPVETDQPAERWGRCDSSRLNMADICMNAKTGNLIIVLIIAGC